MRICLGMAAVALVALQAPLLTAAQAPPPVARHREVTVAAASDLKFAMDDILKDLRTARPDLEVRVTYGSSGNFVAQLANGAPFDVFFSADRDYVRQLSARNLTLPDSEFVYAIGRIVLWVPLASPLDLSRGLEVLRMAAARRIAIANPRHAPYGRAAEAAMKSAQVYAAVRSRLVLGENVAQAAQFVESGAADIGIIALSLAVSPALKSKGRFWEIPPAVYPPIEQSGVILKRTSNPEAARAVTAFVAGQSGQAILERFGFVLPEAVR